MKKKNKTAAYLSKFFMALIVVMWTSASNAADPKAADTKGTDAQVVETKVADLKAASEYRYNPIGKPDPFKPFIDLEIDLKKKVKSKPLSINPLQRASIDQFRVVGIGGDEHSRIAMIQDFKGKFYPIYLGTYIGLNSGRVVQILTDRVIVEEKITLESNKTKTTRITMKLHKEEGEGQP
ncbi:MAG TPA: pilus assembly protein PilP [Syntrophales bacterium]|nr:pilus assembly protein PilP [Syntrophales bacterium]